MGRLLFMFVQSQLLGSARPRVLYCGSIRVSRVMFGVAPNTSGAHRNQEPDRAEKNPPVAVPSPNGRATG